MNANMARLNGDPIKYGDFETQERFYSWVDTNFGENVSETCRARVAEALGKTEPVDALHILNGIIRSTRRVDLSRSRFRVRFSW